MLLSYHVSQPKPEPRRIAVLGASGSIGTSALDVIASSGGRMTAEILSVHSNTEKLAELAAKFHPAIVVVTDPKANRTPLSHLPQGTEIYFGQSGLERAVRSDSIEVVLSAIVGSVGLRSTQAALDANKTVALANKESLVMGGAILMDMIRQGHGRIIPVDSEHSAIYQCLLGRHSQHGVASSHLNSDIAKLILTASGGPFRTWSLDDLRKVKPEDALAHPTWTMGKKVTIDSATMMNKALEIVEAHWLFGVESEKISVVIHPQSIVHSMVEFIDGTVMAQLASPDMRLPIQVALDDRERFDGPSRRLDWSHGLTLEFIPPDPLRFPALLLGRELARNGGTTGAVVNAANEIAVDAFLHGKLSFDRIVPACRTILQNHHYEANPTLDRLFELDDWARRETKKWISL